jgi:hypothetical protein
VIRPSCAPRAIATQTTAAAQPARGMDIAAPPNASPLGSLKGGIAVITGGASGIGLAVAHAALERGLCVCSARRRPCPANRPSCQRGLT